FRLAAAALDPALAMFGHRLDVDDAVVEIDLVPPQPGNFEIARASQDQQPNDHGVFELRRAHLAAARFGESPQFRCRDQIGTAVIALPDFERMLIGHIATPDGFDLAGLDRMPDGLLADAALPRCLDPRHEHGVGADAVRRYRLLATKDVAAEARRPPFRHRLARAPDRAQFINRERLRRPLNHDFRSPSSHSRLFAPAPAFHPPL